MLDNTFIYNAIKPLVSLGVKPGTMYSKELLKGTIEIIILKLLSENNKMYGYEITQRVKELTADRIEISEGALYPLLHKLEATGLLKVESVANGKRIRKYYKLTKTGKVTAKEKIKELNEFMKSISLVMNLKPSGI